MENEGCNLRVQTFYKVKIRIPKIKGGDLLSFLKVFQFQVEPMFKFLKQDFLFFNLRYVQFPPEMGVAAQRSPMGIPGPFKNLAMTPIAWSAIVSKSIYTPLVTIQ